MQALPEPGYPSAIHLGKSIQHPQTWLQITFLLVMGHLTMWLKLSIR